MVVRYGDIKRQVLWKNFIYNSAKCELGELGRYPIKGGLHPYPGVAETLITKALHWRKIPITGDQIAIYYM